MQNDKTMQLIILVLICLLISSVSQNSAFGSEPKTFELFAFDNYMAVDGYTEPKVRADLLKELGYDGMSYSGTKGVVEAVDVFKKAGLRLYITYMGIDLDANSQYEPNLKNAIKQLKGEETMIWLYIKSRTYKRGSNEGDAAAVETIREIADAAHESGLKIALYAHTQYYAETFEETLRIAEKVNRRNVGVSFNVCHWLKNEGDIDYRALLKKSIPYLFVVTTNGAETGETTKMGFDRLIMTLDKGSFDNYKLLKYLKDIGYTGPIGLQGYGIKGDPKQNLINSIKTWRIITGKILAARKVEK